MKIAIRGGHCPIIPGAKGIIDELTEDRKVKDTVIKYYQIFENNVIFNSSKELNCYYTYIKEENSTNAPKNKNIIQRTCFTYPYLKNQNKMLKLDYTQKLESHENTETTNVYYFINQIKD